ncbi:MAG: N-succinylarginine dihydrolase, partial [Planctomycetota bacterium]
MSAREVNFDSIVGPTHNYAGLSPGNIASEGHAGLISRPRDAALEGLAKMRSVMEMGITQGVLPPHHRPELSLLRAAGFAGTAEELLRAAGESEPRLLAAACSASPMWAANAATVAPSSDTTDGRLHLTTANLVSNLHRSIEHEQTTRTLRAIFADESKFAVHGALPSALADEGAANHSRLAPTHGDTGVHFFVYGRNEAQGPAPTKYPARQTLMASAAVARLNALALSRTVFAQQHPAA